MTLHLERTGVRTYVARNDRGAEVRVGKGPGEFSPGDLLNLALAGCFAMSSDARFSAVLGEDFAQVTTVDGEYNETDDVFESFSMELIQDLSSLSDEDRVELLRRAEAAIARYCTIGHTLDRATPYTRMFSSEQLSE